MPTATINKGAQNDKKKKMNIWGSIPISICFYMQFSTIQTNTCFFFARKKICFQAPPFDRSSSVLTHPENKWHWRVFRAIIPFFYSADCCFVPKNFANFNLIDKFMHNLIIFLYFCNQFLREELKYDSGYEKRHKTFHYNDDTQISVKELWEAWLRSEVN